MVVAKTGIPEDQARMAVEVVLQHLKSKLPEWQAGVVLRRECDLVEFSARFGL